MLTVRRRAPASPPRPLTTIMRRGHQMASEGDSELSLPQVRVKCVVAGDPEAVVGTSTAFYDRVHALLRRITLEPPRSPHSRTVAISISSYDINRD